MTVFKIATHWKIFFYSSIIHFLEGSSKNYGLKNKESKLMIAVTKWIAHKNALAKTLL